MTRMSRGVEVPEYFHSSCHVERNPGEQAADMNPDEQAVDIAGNLTQECQ